MWSQWLDAQYVPRASILVYLNYTTNWMCWTPCKSYQFIQKMVIQQIRNIEISKVGIDEVVFRWISWNLFVFTVGFWMGEISRTFGKHFAAAANTWLGMMPGERGRHTGLWVGKHAWYRTQGEAPRNLTPCWMIIV